MKKHLAAVLLAGSALTACTHAGRTSQAAEAPEPETRGARLVRQLADPATRNTALNEVRRLAGSGALARQEGAAILRALPEIPDEPEAIFPFRKRVLMAVLAAPKVPVEWVRAAEEIRPRLGSADQACALGFLLLSEDQPAGIQAFLQHVAAHPDTLDELPVDPLREHTPHGSQLFPALLELASRPASRRNVYLAAFAYLEEGKVPPALLAPHTAALRQHYSEALGRMPAPPEGEGIGWRYEETYTEPRDEAALLLDLLGYLEGHEGLQELTIALHHSPDPRMRFFAARALLRRHMLATPDMFEPIAADPEMRGLLLEILREMGQQELFPARYLTQAALAESHMVQWLLFPTELGRAPDEIELLDVVTYDYGRAGAVDYYVFRFRTHEPHWAAKRGWMAGWSGPFVAGRLGSHGNDTFSRFEAAGSASPREHVGTEEAVYERLVEIMRRIEELQ